MGFLIVFAIIAIALVGGRFVDKHSESTYKWVNEGKDPEEGVSKKTPEVIIVEPQNTKENKKQNKGMRIILVFILLAFYIYLSIPIKVTTSIMGVEMGMTMHYQPLTTCLSYDVEMFGNSAHNQVCGVSPIRIIKAKAKMGDLFEYLYY